MILWDFDFMTLWFYVRFLCLIYIFSTSVSIINRIIIFCGSNETSSSSATVLNHFHIMYQSISFIERLFFSFPSNFLICQLDFFFFWPVWALHSIKSSFTFHFVVLKFFLLFPILWMLVTVNKAEFSLRKTFITF